MTPQAMPTTIRTVPKDERRPRRHVQETGVQLRAEDAGAALPPGVCGRIIVTALTFNTVDTYGTSFAPGCADRSIGQRVPSGRIPLLTDHENEVGHHIGVVRAMPSVGTGYLGECDILDTEDGRKFLEYARACVAAGAVTGASIRFVPRASEMVRLSDGSTMERFTEIELRELTVVPLSSVPNTDLITARMEMPTPAPNETPAAGPAADQDGPNGDALPARNGEGEGEDVDSPADDASLIVRACRTLLESLPVPLRLALLKEYTETDAGTPARVDAATLPPSTVQTSVADADERLRVIRALAI